MNPSTALATVLVDELIRNGVTDAVLAPGSRSAPLALALHAADSEHRLRLHVRIDERSAAFLAVGLAKASGRVVPVACTSGTAAANLHPAVLEAAHSGAPLVVLTADRPPELRGSGANQTIDQIGLYGSAAGFFHDVGAPEERTGQNRYWRTLACRAAAAAQAGRPAHLNVAFREPLLPGPGDDWPESLAGRPDGGPWTQVSWPAGPVAVREDVPGRGLVIADVPSRDAEEAAAALGWPLIVETAGAGSGGEAMLSAGVWLLGDFAARHRPAHVLCFGRPTLHRRVSALLADPDIDVDVVAAGHLWPSPGNNVRRVLRSAASAATRADSGHDTWRETWRDGDRRAQAAIGRVLADSTAGPRIARDVVTALPADALLVLGSSQTIRDVGLTAPARPDLRVVANRGVAGIDGAVSTAIGAALAHGGPAYALLGDLTFLHDSNGLIIGPGEPTPDLTIIVVNDDGGGIFGLLEPGAPEYADSFDRVFRTPHHVDLAALCAAVGVEHVRLDDVRTLQSAVAPAVGIRVLELVVDPVDSRDAHMRLEDAVAAALAD